MNKQKRKVVKKNKDSNKYRILTHEEKEQIYQILKEDNSTPTLQRLAEQYQTSTKNLKRWADSGIERKPGCGRKKLNPEAEIKLKEWILEKSLTKKKKVSRAEIKAQAIKLVGVKGFKASKAWQDEFVKHHDIKYAVNEVLYHNDKLKKMQAYVFELERDRRFAQSQIQQPKPKRRQQKQQQKFEQAIYQIDSPIATRTRNHSGNKQKQEKQQQQTTVKSQFENESLHDNSECKSNRQIPLTSIFKLESEDHQIYYGDDQPDLSNQFFGRF